MDAGNGAAGSIPWLNDGTQNNELAHFLVPGGSTIFAGAGDAVGFWQQDGYFPIVARPLTQPSFPVGGEPSNAALGGCFLDDRFDKNNFFPRWSWEAGNNATDFVYTTPGAPADWADARPNEPAWMVDVDGDGLPDKLIRDTVHTWDLYDAQISFARYLQHGEPLPLGSTGGAASGGALLGSTTARSVPGAIVPSKLLRFNKDELYPQKNGVPTRFWYADINGDGIQDFITSTEFDGVPLVPRVRPGNGRGRFECTVEGQPGTVPCTDGGDAPDYYTINVASASKPWIVAEWTPSSDLTQPRLFAPWYFTDVTGDGLADIVLQRTEGSGSPYVDVYVWVNIDGHTFDCLNLSTQPCQVARLNIGGDTSLTRQRLAFADMNGDGVTDIVSIIDGVYVVSLYDQNTTSWAMRAPRPGLLTRIDNGQGATTRIRYESIQELDLAAARGPKPWTFHSPVQANVVTEVRVDDTQAVDIGTALPDPFSIERLTYFEYRDPAYDRWKRQFVGFRSTIASRLGEDAVTETTYWYGPCERDGVTPRALGGPAPSTGRCAGGSDDEREDTFLSRTGKPVRIDRYIPDSRTQAGDRYLWSKEIQYSEGNWLFWPPQTDHVVVSSFVSEVKTHVYNDAIGVSPGPVDTVVVDADLIQHSPVQNGRKTTRRQYYTLPESGQVFLAFDYGDEAGGDMAVVTERYAVAERSWQYLPSSVPVYFDEDGSRNFETIARDNWFEYDANGDLIGIEADPGPDFGLDRRDEAGRAPAPTPMHSAWWSRLSELHYDPETGVVDEIRGAPWTANPASPQSCTKLVLDDRYREFPIAIKQFKNGCDSPDPLITVLSFDRAFGIPVTKTAPDGGMSIVEIDAFGRPVGVALPDPSSTAFTETVTSVDYGDQGPASYVDVRHYTATFPSPQSLRQVAIFNGLGEPVVSFSPGEGTSWIASGWTKRDVAGRVQQARRPFATTQDPLALASTPVAMPDAAGAGYFDFDHDGFGRERAVQENGAIVLQRTFDRFTVDTRDQEQLPGGPHDGAYHRAVFDGRGNLKASIEGTGLLGGIETEVAYDGLGQPLQVTKSYGGNVGYTRSMTWDLLGRLVINSEPNTTRNGHSWRYAYDDEGRLVGTSDARGCGKNIHYDGLGRVVGEDYSPCLAIHPDHTDPAEPGGLEVEYAYDTYQAGQVSPEIGFNDAAELAAGRLVASRDRGSHTRFNYDDRGRVRRVSRRVAKPSSLAPTIGDGYVDHWLAQRSDFDSADRLTWRTSGVDNAELLVGGVSAESYTYSSRGLLQRITSSYGVLIDEMAYEPDGQPFSIRYGDSATSTQASMTYDARRRLASYTVRRAPAGVWTTGSGPAYPAPDATTTQTDLAAFTFEYDLVGNPTFVRDLADASQYPEHAFPVRERFVEYDDLYRVRRVDYAYGPNGTASFRTPYESETDLGDTRPVPLNFLPTRVAGQRFDYDFLGNTTSTRDDLAARYDRSLGTITNGAVADGPNQLRTGDGIEATHDEAGNLVELKVQRQGNCPSGRSSMCAQWFAYEWDEVGQLVRARRWDFATLPILGAGELPSDAPAWDLRYAYSHGARVLKSAKDSTGVERHTLDVFDTLRFDHLEFDQQVTEDYVRDPRLAHLSLGGGVGHVVFRPEMPTLDGDIHRFINIGDHLGSAAITIDGSTSELVERTTYQAFGALESDYRPWRWDSHREDWKFTGKEEDIEVGLTYFGARYYAANLGRWASADPLTIHGLGGDLNPYAYVGGRVMSHVDPFGLEPVPKDLREVKVDYLSGEWSGWEPNGTLSIGNLYAASPRMSSDALVKVGKVLRAVTRAANLGGAAEAAFDRAIEIAHTAAQPNAHVSAGGVATGVAQAAAGTLQQAAHDPVTAYAAQSLNATLSETAAEQTAGGDLGPALGNAGAQFGIGALLGKAGGPAEGANPVAGSIRGVNPTGSMQNCVACAIATDATLSGSPASAIGGGPFPVAGTMAAHFPGRVWIPANGPAGIHTIMTRWGSGARGIVWGTRGGQPGHVFNVVNQGGTIRFLDGQTGGAAVETGFDSYYLLRTH